MAVEAAQLQANVSVTGADEAIGILNEISSIIDGLIGKFTSMPQLNIGESFAGVASAMGEIGSVGDDVVSSLEQTAKVMDDTSSNTSTFKDSLDQITSSLQQLGDNLGGVFAGRLAAIGSKISDMVSGPMSKFIVSIQQIGSKINDAVSGPINSFISRIQDLASTTSDISTNAFNAFTSKIQDISSRVGDAASGPISSFISRIQDLASKVSDAASGPINSFTSKIQDVASKVSDAASGPINNFIDSIQSFASDIEEAATGPLADLISGIRSLSSNISDAASGPLSSFMDKIKGGVSGIGDFAGSMGKTALSGIQGFVGGIGDAIGGVKDFVNDLGMGIMNLQMIGQTAIGTATALLGPAASAETMQTAFENLLGSTKAASDEMQKLDTFASQTPFKTMDIDQAAAQLIGFGTNTKDVIPDLTAIGDALSAVGKGSVANLDGVVAIFGKMQLQVKVTAADMNQLSDRGINAWKVLEDQTGKTQAQLQKMMANGLLPAGDAIKDLTVGIEKNPLYSGGMAKQSATAAGLISTLQSNWDQMLASFGSPILKGLEPVLNSLGNALTNPGLKTFAASIGQGIVDVFKGIGNFISPLSPKFIEIANNAGKFTSAFNSPVFKQVASELEGSLKNAITWLINALASKQFGDFMHTMGVDLVGAIKVAIPIVKEVASNVISFAEAVGTRVQPIIKSFSAWWKDNWQTVADVFKGVWDAIKGVVQIGWALISGIIKIGLDILGGNWKQVWTDLKDMLKGVWDGIVSIFKGGIEILVGAFRPLLEAMAKIPGPVGDMAKSVLKNFDVMQGGASDSASQLKIKTLNHTIEMHEKSVDECEKMKKDIIKKISETSDETQKHALEMRLKVVDHTEQMHVNAVKAAENMKKGVVTHMKDMSDQVVGHSIIPDMVTSIGTCLGGLGASALVWAADMVSKFVQGIENGLNDVGKAASKIASAISSHLHFSKPDVGPLVDVDNWMPDFGDMLSKGLNDQVNKISGASLKLASTMNVNMNPLQGGSMSMGAPASITNVSGGGYNITINPPAIYLDGRQLSSGLMPYITNAIRYSVGTHGM